MNIQVRTKKLLADLQTPVGIYLKIRDLYPESALLESSDFHGKEDSSSFIALEPLAKFKIVNNKVITETQGKERTEDLKTSLPEIFQSFIKSIITTGENPTKINGLFGYTAYESIRYFEDIETKENKTTFPDLYYIFYRFTLIINHLNNELTIIENIPEGDNSKLNELEALLQNNNYASYSFKTTRKEQSNITDEEYKEYVKKGIAHCKRGDVFQIVLSRNFSQSFQGDDFEVYRTLRSINPSPYLFYFDFGVFRIFGSSPETHCKISDGKAYIDPIAGTYKRTGDDAKDFQLSEKLLKDEKENAEHVMLVDLARNDLSKNCKQVHVDFYKHVQYFSHVIHLVSRVSGTIEKNKNNIAVFADTFPAGTLSGAPKVRAMQLINDIEKYPRGFYGGCIGYIGLNGDLNQAITIRSFMSTNNTLHYQAGAGIVSKSNPEEELHEVNNKLNALKKAIDKAQSTL